MNYNKIVYNYRCSICNTKKFNSIIEECEEVYFPEIYDDRNNIHMHDENGGYVELICENGHEKNSIDITNCECGWNSLEGDGKSCETFINSRQVKTLFDDDW